VFFFRVSFPKDTAVLRKARNSRELYILGMMLHRARWTGFLLLRTDHTVPRFPESLCVRERGNAMRYKLAGRTLPEGSSSALCHRFLTTAKNNNYEPTPSGSRGRRVQPSSNARDSTLDVESELESKVQLTVDNTVGEALWKRRMWRNRLFPEFINYARYNF